MPVEAPTWLNPGDTSWQITAATLVGLMSVPGLAVLYGGVMQKRWSVNSMMLTFATFSVVLIVWVLWGFKMGFGTPWHGLSHSGFFGNFIGKPGPVLSHTQLQHQSSIPLIGSQAFPKSALVYFQFVFAAITWAAWWVYAPGALTDAHVDAATAPHWETSCAPVAAGTVA